MESSAQTRRTSPLIAAIAATACKAPVAILGAECVGKSYPKFFEEYARLGGNYEQYLR